MADNDSTPMTDGDITPPPATTEFQPAEPLKTAGVAFDADTGTGTGTGGDANAAATGSKTDQAKQTVKDYSAKYGSQATDRIRSLADTGKERAVGGLDQLTQMINDAAGQVDDKLGAQYGDYARNAANAVSGFSEQIKAKDVEELLEDARGFVRQSPGVAIGVAAALGFAVARLVQSGIDGNATGNRA